MTPLSSPVKSPVKAVTTPGVSSPARSLAKVFTSLGVASPNSINPQIPFVSPSAQPLHIDEGIGAITTPTPVIREETTLSQNTEQGT